MGGPVADVLADADTKAVDRVLSGVGTGFADACRRGPTRFRRNVG